MATISPVRTLSTTPAAAMALNLARAATSSSRSACCTRRSTASCTGVLQPVGGEARHVQRGEPLAVEPLLDAGDALIVDIDVAEQMRDLGAVRIIALVLVEKADARQALMIDLALLFRA